MTDRQLMVGFLIGPALILLLAILVVTLVTTPNQTCELNHIPILIGGKPYFLMNCHN